MFGFSQRHLPERHHRIIEWTDPGPQVRPWVSPPCSRAAPPAHPNLGSPRTFLACFRAIPGPASTRCLFAVPFPGAAAPLPLPVSMACFPCECRRHRWRRRRCGAGTAAQRAFCDRSNAAWASDCQASTDCVPGAKYLPRTICCSGATTFVYPPTPTRSPSYDAFFFCPQKFSFRPQPIF